jgi:hypothetical protein
MDKKWRYVETTKGFDIYMGENIHIGTVREESFAKEICETREIIKSKDYAIKVLEGIVRDLITEEE